MSDKSKRILTLIVGIITIIIGFIINTNILRSVLVITGIILLTISNSIERNNKKVFIPLFLILFFLFITALDYLVVGAFKRTPILSYSIVKTSDSTVYNAMGYRVWVCNDKDKSFKVDTLYKLGYYCSSYNMASVTIDNILPKLYNNYSMYEDAYIKVTGKISKTISSQEFYMQIYNDDQFDEQYILDVYFNFPLDEVSKRNILDEVTIIGKVDNKQNNIIRLTDSTFMTKSDITNNNDYNFNVNSNIYCAYDKDLWFKLDNRVVYRSCINSIDVFINNYSYDLSFALENEVLSLEELKDLSEGYLTNSKDDAKIFIYNNFKILECNSSSSSDLIIGTPSLSFEDGYCKATYDESEVGL